MTLSLRVDGPQGNCPGEKGAAECKEPQIALGKGPDKRVQCPMDEGLIGQWMVCRGIQHCRLNATGQLEYTGWFTGPAYWCLWQGPGSSMQTARSPQDGARNRGCPPPAVSFCPTQNPRAGSQWGWGFAACCPSVRAPNAALLWSRAPLSSSSQLEHHVKSTPCEGGGRFCFDLHAEHVAWKALACFLLLLALDLAK